MIDRFPQISKEIMETARRTMIFVLNNHLRKLYTCNYNCTTPKILNAHLKFKFQPQDQLHHFSGFHRTLKTATKKSKSKELLGSQNHQIVGQLASVLDIPDESASRLLLKKPKLIEHVDEESLNLSMGILEKSGFRKGTIQEYPDLLLLAPNAIENYIQILNESGFIDIRPFMIINYSSIVKKNINILKSSHFIPSSHNVFEAYVQELDLEPNLVDEIRKDLPEEIETMSPMDLRHSVLYHFLSHRLETTITRIRKIFEMYPRLKHRSFKAIQENIRIMHELVGFPKDRILNQGFLLHSNPHNSHTILNNLETLGGRPILEVIHLRPKVLACNYGSLLQIEKFLHEYGMNIRDVGKYPEIFTLSPRTIQKRLIALTTVPEFIPFKHNPRVGRLLYYFTKIKKRTEYLQSIDISGTSLHILSTDTGRFNKYIEAGEMKNKGADIVQFVSHYLNLPKLRVRQLFMQHPHWLQIPLVSAKEVLIYLYENRSFTNEQIEKALPILLYPMDKILPEIDNVMKSGDGGPEDSYFLNMVIYYIEKKEHFSGDGIWGQIHQVRLRRRDMEMEEEQEHDHDESFEPFSTEIQKLFESKEIRSGPI